MSVTLDTNVYVSALEFGGIGSRLLGMARAGAIQIDVSKEILDELVTVLRDDFHWNAYRMQFAIAELQKLGRMVVPRTTLAVAVDEDDNRILECAAEAGSECIVTSDKHLLRLGEFQGIEIMKPGEFLERGRER